MVFPWYCNCGWDSSKLPGSSGDKLGRSQLEVGVSTGLPLAVPAVVSTAGGGGGSEAVPASSDAPFCFHLGGSGDDRLKDSLFWDRVFQTDGVGREEAGEGSLAIGVCIASGGRIAVITSGDSFSLLRAAFRHVFFGGVAGSRFTGMPLCSS